MAHVQPQFTAFHTTIRLGRFDQEAILREKRDIVRKTLRTRLPGVFQAHDEPVLTPEFRDQGSYQMGTGVRPLHGDYDIDQGVYFAVPTQAYPDPVVLKQRVLEALEGHTQQVDIRRSCVTVFYQRDGEALYHVDLAIYAAAAATLDQCDYLAKGKVGSQQALRVWEASDPQGLSNLILGAFQDVERRQFRHVVRYLKRWRDVQYPAGGHAAPLGIGLTVAAYDDFQAAYTDPLTGAPDDLTALQHLVRAVRERFITVWDAAAQRSVVRLQVYLPVAPQTDLFARMTNLQMEQLRDNLDALQEALDTAQAAVDPVEACTALQAVFGTDFPVPSKSQTARIHAPAIVSSSSSA